MKPQDLDRIRFVTRHFNELKGLFLVSNGMLFLGLGVFRFEQGSSLRTAVVFATSLLMSFGSVVLVLYSRSYYRRTFGEVEPMVAEPFYRPDALTIYSPAGPVSTAAFRRGSNNVRFLRLMLLVAGLGIALYVALRMAGSSADISVYDASGREVRPALWIGQQVIDLVFGSMFLSIWLWRERRLSQSYYLALGVVMLGVAAFGAAQGLLEPILWDAGLIRMMKPLLFAAMDMRTGQLVCGVCLVLAGLLDHWQLVRALRPTAEPHARPFVI